MDNTPPEWFKSFEIRLNNSLKSSNDERLLSLPCAHIYHKQCIMPWLQTKHNCPICRFELTNFVPTNRFDGIEQRFDRIGQRFDRIEQRFDGTEQRFGGIEGKLQAIENKLNAIENNMLTKNHFGTLVRMCNKIN